MQAILQVKRRILLTLATGTGKTVIAFLDLPQVMELTVKPDRRTSASSDFVFDQPERFSRRPKDKTLCPLGMRG